MALADCAPIYTGSPPRVWGRHEFIKRVDFQRRFTPTRVGTTAERRQRLRRQLVHPHACGDDALKPVKVISGPGSPHACGDD